MAPGFALTTLDGEAVDLASLAGKPLVLNFWATWCQPCKLEHPNLLEGARRNPGVAFLGVLYGDTPEKAKRYLDRVGSAYPTLVDPGQRTAMDYGVGGVPETFFIDREGRIVKKLAQPLSATELQRQVEAIQ
jgi:cytochrome c biogenesis protein CcmG/thiol:disulfide interchange protein DsbE